MISTAARLAVAGAACLLLASCGDEATPAYDLAFSAVITVSDPTVLVSVDGQELHAQDGKFVFEYHGPASAEAMAWPIEVRSMSQDLLLVDWVYRESMCLGIDIIREERLLRVEISKDGAELFVGTVRCMRADGVAIIVVS